MRGAGEFCDSTAADRDRESTVSAVVNSLFTWLLEKSKNSSGYHQITKKQQKTTVH